MTADGRELAPVVAGDVQLSRRPGDGTLPRTEAVKDEQTRRWDVVSPTATLIGRPEDPRADVSETVRRLHEERHPAMRGHAERMHRLDRARITQALCNTLDLTPWQRDRALGVMAHVELAAFGSQRAVQKVALVIIRHVVDADRRERLGLSDTDWVAERTAEEMAALADRFTSLSDEERFRELMAAHELDLTSLNRLERVLEDQLDERGIDAPALGRAPFQDPTHLSLRPLD